MTSTPQKRARVECPNQDFTPVPALDRSAPRLEVERSLSENDPSILPQQLTLLQQQMAQMFTQTLQEQRGRDRAKKEKDREEERADREKIWREIELDREKIRREMELDREKIRREMELDRERDRAGREREREQERAEREREREQLLLQIETVRGSVPVVHNPPTVSPMRVSVPEGAVPVPVTGPSLTGTQVTRVSERSVPIMGSGPSSSAYNVIESGMTHASTAHTATQNQSNRTENAMRIDQNIRTQNMTCGDNHLNERRTQGRLRVRIGIIM